MQYGVGVGEDLLGGDGVVGVVFAEASQAPLRDVADALAVLCVAVEREALGIACEVQVYYPIR